MNEFQDQLLTLGDVQDLDRRIDDLRREQAEIPKKLEVIRERIVAAESKYKKRKERLEELDKSRLAKERELEEYEARLVKDNKKLESVANDDIYQKLVKEIAQIKAANDARSDDILILMDKIETEQLGLRKDKAHLDEAKAAIESEARPLKNRLDAIPGETAKYQAERDKMVEGLDRNMMRKYDGLRAQKKGIAIVRVAGRNCGGCNMALSPMLVNKVQRAESMESCPNCGRILYWDEEVRTNPGATPPPPATNA